jgi:hypothetical protein
MDGIGKNPIVWAEAGTALAAAAAMVATVFLLPRGPDAVRDRKLAAMTENGPVPDPDLPIPDGNAPELVPRAERRVHQQRHPERRGRHPICAASRISADAQ